MDSWFDDILALQNFVAVEGKKLFKGESESLMKHLIVFELVLENLPCCTFILKGLQRRRDLCGIMLIFLKLSDQ